MNLPNSNPKANPTKENPPINPPPSLGTIVKDIVLGTKEFENLIQVLMPLIDGDNMLPPEIALELSTTLIELERSAQSEDKLYTLIQEQGTPAIALGETGQILALNNEASERMGVYPGDGISSLGIKKEDFERFVERLSAHADPTLILAHPRKNQTQTPSPTQPILMTGAYYPWFRSFVLKALQLHWPDSIDRAFQELFGLTPSERDILHSLAQGLNSETIADQRKSTPGTVRQQIKGILQKLGTTSQLTAATMAASAAATATATAAAADQSNQVPHNGTTGKMRTQRRGIVPLQDRESPLKSTTFTRKNRRIGWRNFGDPKGTPVLFLHGPSFGAGEYPSDRRLSSYHNLNMFAIERPGYGRTDTPDKTETITECTCNDIMALLDQEKIKALPIVAHEVAIIPALELAHRYPNRVKSILGVSSAPPFVELEQIRTIPHHQGIFIQAARHSPWLAQLLIRLLIIQMRRLGPQRWTETIFGNLKPDAQVMKRPDHLSGIIGTYSFYLNQSGAGFEQDLEMMLTNWGPLVSELNTPLTLIHGCQNPTTPPAYLDIFRSLAPSLPIELIDNAGLTLAISHPHLIYKKIASQIQNP